MPQTTFTNHVALVVSTNHVATSVGRCVTPFTKTVRVLSGKTDITAAEVSTGVRTVTRSLSAVMSSDHRRHSATIKEPRVMYSLPSLTYGLLRTEILLPAIRATAFIILSTFAAQKNWYNEYHYLQDQYLLSPTTLPSKTWEKGQTHSPQSTEYSETIGLLWLWLNYHILDADITLCTEARTSISGAA